MASQEIIDGHIANLKELKQKGGKAQDVLAYLADPEYNVTNDIAEQIFDDSEFRKTFIDTDANEARQLLGQGLLYGGGDEIEGLARAGYQSIVNNKPFYKTAARNIDEVRAENKLYQRARPYRSLGLQMIGSIPFGLKGAKRTATAQVPGILPRMFKSGLVGSGHGLLSGLLRSEGGLDEKGEIDFLGGLKKRASGGIAGATSGFIVGGGMPVVETFLGGAGRFLGNLTNIIPGVKNQSTRTAGAMMRRAMDDDELTSQAIRSRLRNMPSSARIPDTADPYSIAMRDLARYVATTQGGKAANKFLMERQAEQAPRLLEQVDKFLPTMSLDEYLEITSEQKRLDANQNYGDAYAKELEMTDELKSFLNNKKIQEAWSGAQDIAEYDGVDLSDAVEVRDGVTVFAKPTLESMDYIKRSLDDQVNTLYRAGATTKASVAKGLRNRLRDYLDRATADADGVSVYKQARSIYAGHAAAEEAAEEGRKFILRPATFNKRMLANFGSHQKEAFKVGVADALRSQILETGDQANALNKIFNSPAKRNRLRTAFDSDEQFALFEQAMRDEAQMAMTSTRAIQGSRSAPMLADQQAANNAIEAIGYVADPVSAFSNLLNQMMTGGPPSEEQAAELRRLLLDPANQEEALRLMNKGHPTMRRAASRIPPLLRNVLAQQSPRPLVE
tara:strand:+ start:1173 stop:3194 length:2022 start_codon:yes stop_codon:yes gene_type:complete